MRFSQISVGPLFELLRPAIWVLSAYLSARTLADARRRHLNPFHTAAWTLGTLFLPFIIFPLYLIVRTTYRQRAASDAADDNMTDTTTAAMSDKEFSASAITIAPLKLRRTLPVLYLATVLFIIGLYFYNDYRSVDAHLMRANNEQLRNRHAGAIREYRGALKIEPNDAHTHKLLAIQLAATGEWEEALAEFRAAERGGEPDGTLPFRIATVLDAMNRPHDSVLEYERFLNGYCAGHSDDARCDAARRRVNEARLAGDLRNDAR